MVRTFIVDENKHKLYLALLISNYVICLLIGFLFGGYFGFIIGFILALLVDFKSPRWRTGFSWDLLFEVIGRFYIVGCPGGRLIIETGGKVISVYRDEKGPSRDPIRFAVSVPLEQWGITMEVLKDKYDPQFGGYRMIWDSRGKESAVFFPKDASSTLGPKLKEFLTEHNLSDISRARVRVTCITAKIWD